MPGEGCGRRSRSFGTQVGSARGVVTSESKAVQVGTYPDKSRDNTRDSMAQCQQKQTMKQGFPKYQKCEGEVYLFMRGKKDLIQTLKNAFVRDKKIVENFGGTLVGIAEHITRCECDVYRGMREQCVVVILFRSMELAERWTQSSRAFKQRDFPSPADEMEIFAVPVAYQPDEELRAFQLTEMHGLCCSPDEFQAEYVNKATRLMNAERIYHGVVATHNVARLRNCMLQPDTFVLVNVADSEDKLRAFYDSRDYQGLKEYRHRTVAENDSCIFTVRPLS